MLPTDFTHDLETQLSLIYEGRDSVLSEAILYALLGPGKRLRPKLAYLSALACGVAPHEAMQNSLPAMLAVEMVHCYSLVHDDLPAMDNDDYRRGRLSCHKKYGEAVGILVGDALIADAFCVLSTSKQGALLQVRELAHSIGSVGMVLGQHADLMADSLQSTWQEWQKIHALKTGRLFESACVMGGLSVGASDAVIQLLRSYARSFGVAFQLKDDLIDESATVKLLGQEKVEALLNEHVEAAAKASAALKSEGLSLAAQALLHKSLNI